MTILSEGILFVLLFIVVLVVHEVGHVLAFRAIGMRARIYRANYGLYVKADVEFSNIKTTTPQFLLLTWSGVLGCVPILFVWFVHPSLMVLGLGIIWFLYSVFEPLLILENLRKEG